LTCILVVGCGDEPPPFTRGSGDGGSGGGLDPGTGGGLDPGTGGGVDPGTGGSAGSGGAPQAAEWGEPARLDDAGESPTLLADSGGRIVALWQGSRRFRLSEFDNGAWNAPEPTAADAQLVASSLQAGLNGSGGALAIWSRSSGSPDQTIWSASWSPETGWDEPDRVSSEGAATDPSCNEIAVSRSGAAVAVWCQPSSSSLNPDAHEVWVNYLSTSTGWGIPESLSQSATYPRVAIDGSGRAIAVWCEEGLSNELRSSGYTPSTGWSQPQGIGAQQPLVSFYASLAMNDQGSGVAVWYEKIDEFEGRTLLGARYDPGSAWGPVELIGNDQQYSTAVVSLPHVAIGSNGHIAAVWTVNRENLIRHIWANHYVSGVGWNGSEQIDTLGHDAWSPRVAVDGAGAATAVWLSFDRGPTFGFFSVLANRYSATDGWGAPTFIELRDDNAFSPRVQIGTDGTAHSIWSTDSPGIWVNRSN
jgi:hypothetical protein